MTALRLGTRGSRLALWQARWVADRLREIDPQLRIELEVVRTRAEAEPERSLSEIGTGVFTRELDDALVERRIDLAVHSLKDIPSDMPPSVRLAAVPERASPLDAFVSRDGTPLDALSPKSAIGTASPRRKAQLLAHRPDLQVVPLRGNVETRLRKIEDERLAGTVLAVAGLARLGHDQVVTHVLEPSVMVPAVGQGALGVCCHSRDEETYRLLQSIEDPLARLAVNAERAFLHRLRGGCQVPAGALATIDGEAMQVDAVLASPDGTVAKRASAHGDRSAAEQLGRRLADELLEEGGREILSQVRGELP